MGWVTSGTMVPYWVFEDKGLISQQTDEHQLRSICLAYIDSDIVEDDRLFYLADANYNVTGVVKKVALLCTLEILLHQRDRHASLTHRRCHP